MKIRYVEKNIAVCMINSKLDIVLLYLFFLERSAEIIKKILWQKKIVRKGIVEREERGERKKVTVKIAIKKTYLKKNLKGLRISGNVVESETSELKNRYLGIDVSIGEEIIIDGKKEEIKVFFPYTRIKQKQSKIVLLLVDSYEGSVVIINEKPSPIIEKIHNGNRGYGKEEGPDLKKALSFLVDFSIKTAVNNKTELVIASSSIFMNLLKKLVGNRHRDKIFFIEGPFTGSFFSVPEVIRNRRFIEVAKDVPIAIEGTYLEKIRRKMILGNVEYGLKAVSYAIEKRRVSSAFLTTNYVHLSLEKNWEKFKKTLLNAIRKEINVSIVDSKGELGKTVSSLGGIVAI
jgi:stalled ribosome rescue protein Dom34